MAITIRRSESRDLDKTLKLLSEVLELHAKIRPDIFISGTTKYTREELQAIFDNDQPGVRRDDADRRLRHQSHQLFKA